MREKARRGPADGQVIPDDSAGGVVIRLRGDDLRVAVMFSQFRTWVLPKGGVEPGETPDRAAVRELAEEVGLTRLEMRGDLGQTQHDFEMYGKRHHKRVHWFLFLAPDDAELAPNPKEHAFDAGWFPVQEALSLLSHADQRRILRRALRRVQSPPSDP